MICSAQHRSAAVRIFFLSTPPVYYYSRPPHAQSSPVPEVVTFDRAQSSPPPNIIVFEATHPWPTLQISTPECNFYATGLRAPPSKVPVMDPYRHRQLLHDRWVQRASQRLGDIATLKYGSVKEFFRVGAVVVGIYFPRMWHLFLVPSCQHYSIQLYSTRYITHRVQRYAQIHYWPKEFNWVELDPSHTARHRAIQSLLQPSTCGKSPACTSEILRGFASCPTRKLDIRSSTMHPWYENKVCHIGKLRSLGSRGYFLERSRPPRFSSAVVGNVHQMYDSDCDGVLDFDEFSEGITMCQLDHVFPRSLQRTLFDKIDTDKVPLKRAAAAFMSE